MFKNTLDRAAARAIKRAAHSPPKERDPTITILQKTGMRPADVARALGVSPQLVGFWWSGNTVPAGKYKVCLFDLAAGALLAAEENIGVAAVERPELVTTPGFVMHVRNVHEAKQTFLELERIYKQEEGGHD